MLDLEDVVGSRTLRLNMNATSCQADRCLNLVSLAAMSNLVAFRLDDHQPGRGNLFLKLLL